jgi:hypothetical protein
MMRFRRIVFAVASGVLSASLALTLLVASASTRGGAVLVASHGNSASDSKGDSQSGRGDSRGNSGRDTGSDKKDSGRDKGDGGSSNGGRSAEGPSRDRRT